MQSRSPTRVSLAVNIGRSDYAANEVLDWTRRDDGFLWCGAGELWAASVWGHGAQAQQRATRRFFNWPLGRPAGPSATAAATVPFVRVRSPSHPGRLAGRPHGHVLPPPSASYGCPRFRSVQARDFCFRRVIARPESVLPGPRRRRLLLLPRRADGDRQQRCAHGGPWPAERNSCARRGRDPRGLVGG